jgi:hypothetical protein
MQSPFLSPALTVWSLWMYMSLLPVIVLFKVSEAQMEEWI